MSIRLMDSFLFFSRNCNFYFVFFLCRQMRSDYNCSRATLCLNLMEANLNFDLFKDFLLFFFSLLFAGPATLQLKWNQLNCQGYTSIVKLMKICLLTRTTTIKHNYVAYQKQKLFKSFHCLSVKHNTNWDNAN